MNQAIEYDARDSLLTNNSLLCLCSRPIIDHARGDRIPCQTGGFVNAESRHKLLAMLFHGFNADGKGGRRLLV